MMRRALLATVVLVCMVASGTAAGRPWRTIRGPNVIVFGQQSANALRDVAVEIEQFRLVVAELIHGARQPLPLPTLVFAFDDAQALRPYVPLYHGKPVSLAGFCHCGGSDDMSVIAASLTGGDESSSIVFHEYAHHLIGNAAKNVPLWLNEGLAEFFSTFTLKSNRREAIVGRPMDRHLALLARRVIPVADLLAVDHKSPMYNEGDRRSIFYAEAWALTHYLLIDRPGGQDAINRYLAAAAKGAVTPQSLADAAGMTFAQMDLELQRYVRRPAFGELALRLKDRVDVGEPDTARTIPDAEADARLGDLLLRVGRIGEARRRIEAAAVAAPDLATPQLELALLRVREHRDQDSVAPLEKAAALAPKDFIAQYLFALTMLRRGGDLDDEGARRVAEQAYDALTRALAVNPESAAALAWHAYADMQLDVRWTEARDETIRAIALSPGRADYQLQLALIDLHHQDTYAAGRSLLTSLAETTTEESVANRAREVLQQLHARETATGPAYGSLRPADNGPSRPIDVGPADDKFREHPETGTRELRLRKVRAGEERALGDLVAMDCAPSGVRFHVRTPGRVIVATAARMEDVELTSFVEDKDFAVACGAHASPERVLLTWRAGATNRDGTVGTAVAVEFLPKNYVP